MTSRTCPNCGRVLDPLRAPIARIVDGKVVSYCSIECKNGIHPPALEPPPEPGPPPLVPLGSETDITPVPASERVAPPAIVPPTPAPRPRGRAFSFFAGAGLVAILAAAAAFLVSLGGEHRPGASPAPAAAPPAPAPAPVPPPAPPPPPSIDRATVVTDARAVLSGYLADPSPRVRQHAAAALARTGDPAAIAELAKAMASDGSEIRRLEVAYALARSGDARGLDYLVAGLRASHRDARLESARSLARLGDARGKDRLREAMDITSLRLGAAETLALLGDPQATGVLKDALRGPSREGRMRAAVALGLAGDATGIEVLRAMTAEARIELGAAMALARLKVADCVPALLRALGLSATRVDAALALRRLGAEVDPALLAPALATGDPVGRISAAEAALILYDPATPAELR
jgi:HEAT repeat protein